MKAVAGVETGTPLRELTRRWFLYLVSFRQMSEKPSASAVQGQLDGLLREMDRQASAVPTLNTLYQQVRPVLVYFADEILLNCGWSDESVWAASLMEVRVLNTRIAGTQFFKSLNEELKRGNRDILEIYYKCLALGFMGMHASGLLQLATIRHQVLTLLEPETVESWRFCPEAYDAVHLRPFKKFPMVDKAKVALAFVLTLALIYSLGYFVSIWQAKEITKRADNILRSQRPVDDGVPVEGKPH